MENGSRIQLDSRVERTSTLQDSKVKLSFFCVKLRFSWCGSQNRVSAVKRILFVDLRFPRLRSQSRKYSLFGLWTVIFVITPNIKKKTKAHHRYYIRSFRAGRSVNLDYHCSRFRTKRQLRIQSLRKWYLIMYGLKTFRSTWRFLFW